MSKWNQDYLKKYSWRYSTTWGNLQKFQEITEKKNLKGIPEGNIGGILEQTQERISEETSNGNTNRGSSNGISRGSFAKPPKEISRRMPT